MHLADLLFCFAVLQSFLVVFGSFQLGEAVSVREVVLDTCHFTTIDQCYATVAFNCTASARALVFYLSA